MLKISTIARHGEAHLKSQSWGGWGGRIFNLGASVGYTVSLRTAWATYCFKKLQRRIPTPFVSTVATDTLSIYTGEFGLCQHALDQSNRNPQGQQMKPPPLLCQSHHMNFYGTLRCSLLKSIWPQGTKETKESLLECGSRETCFLEPTSSWFYSFLVECQRNSISCFSNFNTLYTVNNLFLPFSL